METGREGVREGMTHGWREGRGVERVRDGERGEGWRDGQGN